MAYEFNPRPRVVQNKTKFRKKDTDLSFDEENIEPNIYKDKRAPIVAPSIAEEEYIKYERNKIKKENMYALLDRFRVNYTSKHKKSRISPYDLRPMSKTKVPANLSFFLTDNSYTEPESVIVDTQTEDWLLKPESPKYVPKKTGHDAETQVEDNELFDFDREVTPIVRVLSTKTVEQAVVEIEEEEELRKISQFKTEFAQRRQEDERKWNDLLQKEVDIIKRKNSILDNFREREDARCTLVRRCQAYLIANLYTRDLNINTLSILYGNRFFNNKTKEAIEEKVPEFLTSEIVERKVRKTEIRQQLETTFEHIVSDLVLMRNEADEKTKKTEAKLRRRRINLSKVERRIRMCHHEPKTPASLFLPFLPRLYEPKLEIFMEEYREKLLKLKDKLDEEDILFEEYEKAQKTDFPEINLPTHLRLIINDFDTIGFTVAQNIYYRIPPKGGHFKISAYVFDREQNFLYKIDETNESNETRTIKYKRDIKDTELPVCDDSAIIFKLGKMESDIGHIILCLETQDLDKTIDLSQELQYSRFRITDYFVNHAIDSTEIMKEYKFDEIRDMTPEGEETKQAKILCYYLFKLPEYGWMMESTKTSRAFTAGGDDEFIRNLERFLITCWNPDYMELQHLESGLVNEAIQAKEREKPKPKYRGKPGKKSKEEKQAEELPERKYYVVNSRSYGPLVFNKSDNLDQIKEIIHETLKKESPLVLENFEYGYEIFINGRPLVKQQQIFWAEQAKDFTFRAKPKPLEVKKDSEMPSEQGDSDDD